MARAYKAVEASKTAQARTIRVSLQNVYYRTNVRKW
jgi:hypothetical protein